MSQFHDVPEPNELASAEFLGVKQHLGALVLSSPRV